MIKTVRQIREDIKFLYTESMIEEVLKEWADSIIDECANKAGELAYPGTEKMVQVTIEVTVKKQL